MAGDIETLWKKIDQLRDEASYRDQRAAVIESRVGNAEARLDAFTKETAALNTNITGLREDINRGRNTVRVLLWVGGTIAGVIAWFVNVWVKSNGG